jgi:nucleoside-diphosphate-sugar epimerase
LEYSLSRLPAWEGENLKILIIGGTRFLGHAVSVEALLRGHEVTLFHRGQSSVTGVGGSETILGDRDGGMGALGNRNWDAVIDTCGYVPRVVRQSVQALADHASHYLFVSTISVYAPGIVAGADESAPLAVLDDDGAEEITGDTYGGLKVLCEREVASRFPTEGAKARGLLLRPGFIVGPRDYSWRFPYWVGKLRTAETVVYPGNGQELLQLIDVRDVAQFIVSSVESSRCGIFNATGPSTPLPWSEFLSLASGALGAEPTLLPASLELLDSSNISAGEFPLFVDGDGQALMQVSVARARAAGLGYRPMAETVRETAIWLENNPPEERPAAWPKPESESRLLATLGH